MILIVSYPGEEHTADVVQRLERQGREVVQINLADFPAHRALELSWGTGKRPSYLIDGLNGPVDLRNAHAGWWRRICPYDVDKAIVNPSLRAFAASETAQAVSGMLDALPCNWVNPRKADEIAHHKPYQWAIAHEVGLRMPKTLVTNRPEAACRFVEEMGVGRTIFKAFLATQEAWRETRIVEREDLDRLDLVRYAPVIFQEYVEGVDLRITVVGSKVFAAEIDARKTRYPFDMRMVVGEAEVRSTELSEEVHTAVLKLQRRLGLYYGAIDMRRTPGGEYIFFEVNPAGQWLFVEQRTGMAISQAIADLLAEFEDSPLKEEAA